MANNNWIGAFIHWLSIIRITSKEADGPVPIIPYGAQTRFLNELVAGLSRGQHLFVCLKARQLGISTVLLALDIFWLYMHPGLRGALVADTDENRMTFRITITEMLDSLPVGFRIPIRSHNRTGLVLANGSQLQYMVAGKRKNSGLGKSRGLNFVHGTELGEWGDQAGFDSLMAALAVENPNRLYVFESTAKGFNLFYDLYEEALVDPQRHAFFIGWWAKELYAFKEGTPEYAHWWGRNTQLSTEEQATYNIVKQLYDHEINSEQWAWYRAEAAKRGKETLNQDFPSTAAEAFTVTGASFFNIPKLNGDSTFVRERVGFRGYAYTLGMKFDQMAVREVTNLGDAELRIWEQPKKRGRYVIGVDPAYGSSPTADRHVISVWRCYADKMIQVAEYATEKPETRQVAWVLAHVAMAYRDCMINLEINGPGPQVMAEMKSLKDQIQYKQIKETPSGLQLAGALDQARWFLYHRPEQVSAGYVYNWTTNQKTKPILMNEFRDLWSTDRILARSIPLMDEMITLVQSGAKIAASGRNKDDRVMAAALAAHAWTKWIRGLMMQDNRTFEIEQEQDRVESTLEAPSILQLIVPNHFENMKKQRAEQERQRFLEGW